MELRHLQHFVAVAEELHFARAADRLGMEQSPLSQSIRNLETQLGTKLLQRTTRRTWLTRAGIRFYREARRILRDIDALTASVRRTCSEEPEAICLALGDDLASEPFTRFMFELEHHEPKISLEIRELLHADAVRLVRDGGADVAITLNSKPEPELTHTLGWNEPLMVVAPLGHPFGEQDRISVRDLSGHMLALPSAAECPGYLAQVEELLTRHQVQSTDRRNVSHWNTAVSFAATGHAIALCPATMVHTATSVVVVPIVEVDATLGTWLLHREDELSPAVTLVLETAADVASGALPFFLDRAV